MTAPLQQTIDDQGQTIEDQAQAIAALQQTVDGQNDTISTLQQTVDDKCEIIERQQMTLQQVNASLQMFIETQETSNSEQDVIAANLTTLLARFPRKAFLP